MKNKQTKKNKTRIEQTPQKICYSYTWPVPLDRQPKKETALLVVKRGSKTRVV